MQICLWIDSIQISDETVSVVDPGRAGDQLQRAVRPLRQPPAGSLYISFYAVMWIRIDCFRIHKI